MSHRRNSGNTAMRDAFLKSQGGKQLAYEAKIVAGRIRNLKQLVHDTFVTKVPKDCRVRFDVYQAAKPVCKRLGQEGGMAYDNVIRALKWTWTSDEAYSEAIRVITQ